VIVNTRSFSCSLSALARGDSERREYALGTQGLPLMAIRRGKPFRLMRDVKRDFIQTSLFSNVNRPNLKISVVFSGTIVAGAVKPKVMKIHRLAFWLKNQKLLNSDLLMANP